MLRATLSAALANSAKVFETLSQRDILLHHPYESFGAVVDLLRDALQDPKVLAIRQTLYRAGKDTPLVDLLVEAARNSKTDTATCWSTNRIGLVMYRTSKNAPTAVQPSWR